MLTASLILCFLLGVGVGSAWQEEADREDNEATHTVWPRLWRM